MLQAHLIAGDVAGAAHQGGADPVTSVIWVGLDVVDDAPVRDERIEVAAQPKPAGEHAIDGSEEQPVALRIAVGEEPVRDEGDLLCVNGWEGEPTAPPALATVIQQLISCCLNSGVISCGPVI